MQESFCPQCQLTFSGEGVPLKCHACATTLIRKEAEGSRSSDTLSATLFIGMLLIVGGIIGYFVCAPKIEAFQSGFGSLATAFSQGAASELERWQVLYYVSIGAIVLGGLCLFAALFDAIRASQKR